MYVLPERGAGDPRGEGQGCAPSPARLGGAGWDGPAKRSEEEEGPEEGCGVRPQRPKLG